MAMDYQSMLRNRMPGVSLNYTPVPATLPDLSGGTPSLTPMDMIKNGDVLKGIMAGITSLNKSGVLGSDGSSMQKVVSGMSGTQVAPQMMPQGPAMDNSARMGAAQQLMQQLLAGRQRVPGKSLAGY